MRFREVLLEYKRAETAKKQGEALRLRFIEDSSLNANTYAINFRVKIEGKMLQHKDELKSPESQKDFVINSLIEEIEDLIPDKFIPWAIRLYITHGIKTWEDFYKAGDFIEYHMYLRQSGYFKRHPDENINYGDIFKFKSLSDLGKFVLKVRSEGQAISNNQKDRDLENELISSGQAEIVLNDSDYKIVIPKSVEAAQFYGRNTQWCTSADKDNMFESYNDQGPLYIILDKKNNKRWQFHFESGQFMNENDESVLDKLYIFEKLFNNDRFVDILLRKRNYENLIIIKSFPASALAKFLPKCPVPYLVLQQYSVTMGDPEKKKIVNDYLDSLDYDIQEERQVDDVWIFDFGKSLRDFSLYLHNHKIPIRSIRLMADLKDTHTIIFRSEHDMAIYMSSWAPLSKRKIRVNDLNSDRVFIMNAVFEKAKTDDFYKVIADYIKETENL